MNIHLVWYNPSKKQYQVGCRELYKKTVNDSNEPENFFLLKKFSNLSERAKDKLALKILGLNNVKIRVGYSLAKTAVIYP